MLTASPKPRRLADKSAGWLRNRNSAEFERLLGAVPRASEAASARRLGGLITVEHGWQAGFQRYLRAPENLNLLIANTFHHSRAKPRVNGGKRVWLVGIARAPYTL